MGVLLFLFISLASGADDFSSVQKYINDFVSKSRGKVRFTDTYDSKYEIKPIKDKKEGSRIIGYCYTNDLHTLPYRIELDKSYWRKGGWTEKWKLVFHELGHCACGREHTDEIPGYKLLTFLEKYGIKTCRIPKLPDGCPISLMNSSLPSSTCVDRHKAYYVKEMFDRCTVGPRLQAIGYLQLIEPPKK